MNPITFPGLGLTFHIQRVAFSILGKDIYWYGIIIACGFLLGVLYACRQCRELGVEEDQLLDMLCFAVPVALLCARLYYVVFYLDLYRNPDGSFDWGEMVAIWDGGVAIYGGILGAVATCLVFCKVRKCAFLPLADCAAFGLLIGQALGRWGNFVNQEAYGGPCTLPWRMGLTLSSGEYIEVHPTFLYESLWNVVGLLLLIFVVKRVRKVPGQIFFSYVFWYGLGRFWIEGMRTDSLYFFGTGLRVSQGVALLSMVAAVIFFFLRRKAFLPAKDPNH